MMSQDMEHQQQDPLGEILSLSLDTGYCDGNDVALFR